MNLGQAASEGASRVSSDTANGFARAVTLVAPDALTYEIQGLFTDVSQQIDLDTGMNISGRYASIVLHNAVLSSVGAGTPYGERDAAKRPWLVRVPSRGTFKVTDTRPDHIMGLLVCVLEVFEE